METNQTQKIKDLEVYEENLPKVLEGKVAKKSRIGTKIALGTQVATVVGSYIGHSSIAKYFLLRLQDGTLIKVYQAFGAKAANLFSVASNAIIASPAVFASAVAGTLILVDIMVLGGKKIYKLVKKEKTEKPKVKKK